MPRNYKRRFPGKKMGYGTRYYSSRRYPGLYRSNSKYNLIGSALRRIGKFKLRQAIKSVAERKWYDNTLFLSNALPNQLDINGFFFSLTDMPQGSGQQQRIGDKCTGSSIEVRMVLSSPALVTTAVYLIMRTIIFVWKDDTAPGLADILEPGAWNPVNAPLNHDTKIKRKILYDACSAHYLETVTKNSMSPLKYKKIVLPLNKLRNLNIINFQAGTTVGVNHIYILHLADTPAVANQTWTLNASYRYNFIDM